MLYRGTSFEKVCICMFTKHLKHITKPNPTPTLAEDDFGPEPVYILNWIDTVSIQTYRGFLIKYKKLK